MFETVFSEDRLYRYTLWRSWGDDLFVNRTKEGFVQWIGLNPSTADENINDPTVRRCIDFTKRWGYLAMCMTNAFAFRSMDYRKMLAYPQPIGCDNDRWLAAVAREASLIIACWGNHGTFMGRDEEICKLLDDLHCLAVSKEGNPKHPLYLKGDLLPVAFTPRHATDV